MVVNVLRECLIFHPDWDFIAFELKLANLKLIGETDKRPGSQT